MLTRLILSIRSGNCLCIFICILMDTCFFLLMITYLLEIKDKFIRFNKFNSNLNSILFLARNGCDLKSKYTHYRPIVFLPIHISKLLITEHSKNQKLSLIIRFAPTLPHRYRASLSWVCL